MYENIVHIFILIFERADNGEGDILNIVLLCNYNIY